MSIYTLHEHLAHTHDALTGTLRKQAFGNAQGSCCRAVVPNPNSPLCRKFTTVPPDLQFWTAAAGGSRGIQRQR
jgi:hypothetical protein